MNLVDLALIIFLIIGALIGFRSGAVKALTSFVGVFVMMIIAFMFKDQLSVILYENMPFFNLFGPLAGIEALNIVLYDILAFVIILVFLMGALHIVLVISGLFDLILKMTVILSVPSKIIGIIVGVLEYYVYAFIILFVVNLPMFHLSVVNESKYGSKILNETPFVSNFAYKSVDIYNKIYNVVDNRGKKDERDLNKETLEVMLDNKFITYNSAIKLVNSNKIHLNDKEFLEKYK